MAAEQKSVDELELAIESIRYIINNDWDSCQKLLNQYKDTYPMVSYCYGLFSFTKAILIFEESDLEKAGKDLEKSQKLCKEFIKACLAKKKNPQTQTKFDNVKGKLFNEESKLQTEVLLADLKLFTALLTIIKQDIPAIIATGVFEMRRAWKLYSSIHKRIFNLYKQLDPNAEQVYGTDPTKLPELKMEDAAEPADDPDALADVIQEISIDSNAGPNNGDELSLDAVKRLLASVSFGYGIVQLCFSFLPPSILKLLKFIGFEGDRSAALRALYFTSQSNDLRAPFSDLTLVFYSTMGRQIFGYSEVEMYLNEKEISQLLEKNLKKNENSCMFLMQKGKLNEFNLKNLDAALEAFYQAQQHADKLPEIKCITFYEIGLIHLLNLNYPAALDAFTAFAKDSKWSLSFNGLLIVLLNGSLGNFDVANQKCKDAAKITQRKNPIEIYSHKRIEFLKKYQIKSKAICQFLIVELLYLWVFLPYANEESLKKMLEILYELNDKTLIAIQTLLEASIQFELKDLDSAELLYKEAIARDEKQNAISKYVQAYANVGFCLLYIERGEYDLAQQHLQKSKSFKDYDLEDRIQIQMRCLQRRIDYKKSLKNPK